MKFLGTELTRDIERDMFDYMPKEYEDYKESRAIVQAEATEFERLNEQIAEVLAQFYIETATWGIAEWERIFGITYKQGESGTFDSLETNFIRYYDLDAEQWQVIAYKYGTLPPIADRRANVRARLRGVGTVTPALIKNVVQAYTNGEVEIIESPSTYQLTIQFVDTVGVPPNYEDVKRVIQEIIPAHIAVTFTNKYALWSNVKATTWGNAKTYTWADLKGGLFNA